MVSNLGLSDLLDQFDQLKLSSNSRRSLHFPCTGHVVFCHENYSVVEVLDANETVLKCHYLRVEASSVNLSDRKEELYIAAPVEILRANYIANGREEAVTNPHWSVGEYKHNTPRKLSYKQMAGVTQVSYNCIKVVGLGFEHPSPVYMENVADISPEDFVIGEVHTLAPFLNTQLIGGNIYHCRDLDAYARYLKAKKEVAKDKTNSAAVLPEGRKFMTSAVRLTSEEKRHVVTRCRSVANLTLDQAQLYIRDPLVATTRLEVHRSLLSAKQHTVEVDVRQVVNRAGTKAKVLLCFHLNKDQTLSCVKSKSKDSWNLGSELVLSTRGLGKRTLDVMIDSIKDDEKGGSNIELTVSKQSQELMSILSRVNYIFKDPCTIGPQTSDIDEVSEAIRRGFDNFFNTKRVLFDAWCGKESDLQEDTTKYNLHEPFFVKGTKLDPSQLVSMRTAAAAPGWTCVAAPPGSGKTFMISALVKNRCSENVGPRDVKGIAISSTTNAAVNNAVEAVNEAIPKIRMCRDYSVKAENEISEVSKQFSLRKMSKNAGSYVSLRSHPSLAEAITRREAAQKALELPITDLATGLRRLATLKGAEYVVRTEFLKAYRPVVYGATCALMVRGNCEATHLILDEASQLSAAMALALYCSMLNLEQITLVGDSKQLKPYSDLIDGSFAQKMVADGELARMEAIASSRKCMLKTIYRCHPRIVDLFLRPLYGEDLQSGVTATQRNLAAAKGLPVARDGSPCLLVHLEGARGESCFNRMELETVLKFIFSLRARNIPYEDVAVVCHHRAQRDALMQKLKGKGNVGSLNLLVSVNTVDSFQGKEAKVVLVLTTKTSFGRNTKAVASALSFISDYNRETVAVSRAQHVMYIFGDWRGLVQTNFWSQFGAAMYTAGAIVDDKWNQIKDANWIKDRSVTPQPNRRVKRENVAVNPQKKLRETYIAQQKKITLALREKKEKESKEGKGKKEKKPKKTADRRKKGKVFVAEPSLLD